MRTTTRIWQLAVAITGAAAILAGCKEELPPPDANELYTRDFVEEFGEFKAESWSEARSVAITVVSDHPTPVTVLAEISGQRFMFATLSSVNGTQPIIMNVPRSVKEFIVLTDDGEYRTKPGSVLDLSKSQSRVVGTVSYVDAVPGLENVKPNYNSANNREIEFNGFQLEHYFNRNVKFGSPDNLMFNEHDRISNSARYLVVTKNPWLTIYPLYWRTNRYGESDYMLGVYIYHVDSKKVIAMYDLEDFDIHNSIRLKNDADGWTVASGNEAYDFPNSLKESDVFRTYGAHIHFDGINNSNNAACQIGFYVKSGLKETSTPNWGRDAAHITYQHPYFNSPVWKENNFWDLPLKRINYAYTGAATGQSTVTDFAKYWPKHIDTFTYEVYDYEFYPLGFSSQPDGVDSSSPDFCDCVFLVSGKSIYLAGNEKDNAHGEKFGVYPWYLAAEDLGTTDDWDFNDLIVTIYDITTDFTRQFSDERNNYPVPPAPGRHIVVEPKAAGGIMPIYLMYEGEVAQVPDENTKLSELSGTFTKGTFMIGTEMHRWLGADDHTQMLNTDGVNIDHTGRAVSFCVPIAKEGTPEFDPYKIPQDLGEKNQTMRGFWVLVDKNDELRLYESNAAFDPSPFSEKYIADTKHAYTPFSGKLGEGIYRIDPPINTGGSIAPQMLMCHYTWHWPRERAKISDVYLQFSDWVQGKRPQWHNTDDTPNMDIDNNSFNPELICNPEKPQWME